MQSFDNFSRPIRWAGVGKPSGPKWGEPGRRLAAPRSSVTSPTRLRARGTGSACADIRVAAAVHRRGRLHQRVQGAAFGRLGCPKGNGAGVAQGFEDRVGSLF